MGTSNTTCGKKPKQELNLPGDLSYKRGKQHSTGHIIKGYEVFSRPMSRILMTILIIFMALGPIAQVYLAYELNAVQTVIPEEENHEEKPDFGKNKGDVKEKYYSNFFYYEHRVADLLRASHLHQLLFLSDGYAGTPLMPPEVV